MTLSQKMLFERLVYDPETGIFTYRSRPANCVNIGDRAGTVCSEGYIKIKIAGINHSAHRLAWLYVHGTWPPKCIDHVNGIRSDNRLSNLRLATNYHNALNRRSKNSTGFRGVERSRRQFKAKIIVEGKSIYLGLFPSPEEAYRAYCAAAKRLHGEFARVA